MLLKRMRLQNVLSFGPNEQELEFKPLNVLIGPNGAGKSNVIEVIGLLSAAPTDIAAPIREGGAAESWVWGGYPRATEARVDAVVIEPLFEDTIRYSLSFRSYFDGSLSLDEIGEVEASRDRRTKSFRFLERQRGKATLAYRDATGKTMHRALDSQDVRHRESILSQVRDPGQYPELSCLEASLREIRLYREWSFGRNTPPRLPQRADLPNQSLDEDGRNLGMVLNRIERDAAAKQRLLTGLRQLYDGIDDYYVQVEAGSVQVFLKEGAGTIPATRLSDGTLRYLSLLAILCNPSPVELLCIEEPELGLHPDVLPGLADLLREASERCQLIVTTHSDVLVDALTETPESVVICEKENGQTRLKRLDRNELSHWLEKYRLGELWTSGELGGNRW